MDYKGFTLFIVSELLGFCEHEYPTDSRCRHELPSSYYKINNYYHLNVYIKYIKNTL